MTVPDLKPKGLGRIFDEAFSLYRANFRALATASLAVLFPAALAAAVGQAFYLRGYLALLPQLTSETEPTLTGFSDLFAWASLANVGAPLVMLAQAWVAASVLTLAPRLLSGERPTTREVLRAGKARFGWLALASLLAWLAVQVGLVFLLVPGIVLWWRLSLVRVVTVVEAAPLDRAFSRSWSLSAGAFWRTVGFSITLSILVLCLQSVVNMPAGIRQIVDSVQNPEAVFQELSAGWTTLEGVLAAVATALVAPFGELAWFAYYLDRRARREGMDIVAEASDLVGSGR